jgi:glycosyltransferase involved in cell wall biosynthesis
VTPPRTRLPAGTQPAAGHGTGSRPTVVVAVHDGFYGCGTGAGMANRGLLRALADQLRPEVHLVILPVRLATTSGEYQPDWHQQTLRALHRADIHPVDNGSLGHTRYGGLDHFRRLAADTARQLIAEILPAARQFLVLAVDVPFHGLAPHLPDTTVRHLVLLPRATARLHDPTNRQRIAWEAYGLGSAAARGARIACISAHMRHHLTHDYQLPLEALIDLPDGLHPDDHAPPAPHPSLPPGAAAGFLLAMGRAEPYKGFDDLLTALEHLTTAGTPMPHLLLAAVSDQPTPTDYQQHLARRARTLSTPITLLTRYHPGIRALLWHPGLRGVIVPSRTEPFGRIPLEAYAAGAAPVIATTAGGLTETVHDRLTGHTAPPANPAALAAALTRALTMTEQDRQRMRAAGKTLLATYQHPAAVARFLTDYVPWALPAR